MRPRPIPDGVLAEVFARLGTALAAGVDVRRAVAAEAARVPARWRAAVEVVAASVAEGGSLADALGRAGEAFPPAVIGMVAVGERAGRDAETLADVAAALRGAARARREFLASLVGPSIRLAAALAVIGVLILVSGITRDLDGRPLDLLGIGLTGSTGLTIYVGILVAGAVGVVVGWPAVERSWRTWGLVRRLAGSLPLIGPAAAAGEAARWSRAAALAAHAGVDAGGLVELASRAAPGLSLDPRDVERRLRGGDTLAEALEAGGRLPRRVLDTVAAGEVSGTTAESLARLVPHLEEESRRGFTAAAATLGFAAWAAVAGLIVLVVFRLAAVYIGIIEAAGKPL